VNKPLELVKRVKLPSGWLPLFLISGSLFGISQWVTRYTCGQTTIFFRFLRFGKANFFATAVVDLCGPLILMGLGTAGWKAGVFVMKAIRKSPARSRAGRGVQKMFSLALGIFSYYLCYYVPIYAALKTPWLGGIYAVLVMQYPLHVLIGLATSIYQRRLSRQKKPINFLLRFFKGLKSFIAWSWKFFFFPTETNYSESDFAPKEEIPTAKPGEGEARTFADTFFNFLNQNSYFWREWNKDLDHLYPELEDALIGARENSAGQSALKNEGFGYQLVAEIKQEAEGYRLIALTVIPSSQALQPGIQYSVDSIPDAVGED